MIIYFLTVLFLFCSAGISQAATYYVAKTSSSDSNSCAAAQTLGTAKLTITSGISCLAAGDTLIVKAGTYTESVMNITSGSSWGTPVIVKAATGEVVTVRPNVGATHPFGFNNAGTKYVSVEGFVIDAVNVSYGVFVDSDVNAVRIQDCEIKDSKHQGIFMGGNLHEIFRNHVHHTAQAGCSTGAGKCHGMYLTGDGLLIEGNEVSHSESHGIHIYNGAACCPDDDIVRENIIYDNTARGIGVYSGQRNQIYNNVFYHTAPGSTHLAIHYTGHNGEIYSNTVYNNRVGVLITGSGNDLRNNILYNNSSANLTNTGGATTSNNLTTNPSFINAGAANFELQPSSAAIGAGIELNATFTTDILGVTRGATWDIGAYEYVAPGGGGPTGVPGIPTGVSLTE